MSSKKYFSLKFIFFIILISSSLFSKDIIFGVVPQQSPSELVKTWAPIVSYLSKETGLHLVFKTESSIPKFEEELYAGNYDIAYMNPYHFVIANKQKGYKAIARTTEQIEGILVTHTDKRAFDINEFKGKTFLFPAPNAFAATLLAKYELKKKYGFDIEKDAHVLYVNSHDSVYKGVARGVGDIGGGISRTLEQLHDSDTASKIKILYKTDSYPSHPIAVLPSIENRDVDAIREALLKMPKEILEKLTKNNSMIKTDSLEFDEIKKLSVELGKY